MIVGIDFSLASSAEQVVVYATDRTSTSDLGRRLRRRHQDLDVHIKRPRTKIEDDPANPRYLITVRGLGYKFEG